MVNAIFQTRSHAGVVFSSAVPVAATTMHGRFSDSEGRQTSVLTFTYFTYFTFFLVRQSSLIVEEDGRDNAGRGPSF